MQQYSVSDSYPVHNLVTSNCLFYNIVEMFVVKMWWRNCSIYKHIHLLFDKVLSGISLYNNTDDAQILLPRKLYLGSWNRALLMLKFAIQNNLFECSWVTFKFRAAFSRHQESPISDPPGIKFPGNKI